MNYISHLNTFLLHHVKYDRRLTSNHISLYIALFQFWNLNRFKNPFYIRREEVINITGIGSKNTYHKCLKDLHQFGYILYRPSKDKFQKCKIYIARLDGMRENLLKQLELFETENPQQHAGLHPAGNAPSSVPESVPALSNCVPDLVPHGTQNCDRNSTSSGTGTVANMGLLLKHKQSNLREREETPSLPGKISLKNPPEQKANDRAAETIFNRPEITQVLSFFKKNNYPDYEGKKFFNHYQSNGWLVSGTTPMSDWHSSAHKWMLNIQRFENIKKQKALNNSSASFSNDKNFGEPL